MGGASGIPARLQDVITEVEGSKRPVISFLHRAEIQAVDEAGPRGWLEGQRFDAEGNFYFTDPVHRNPALRESPGEPTQRRGSVYYASPDGSFIRRVVTDLQHPNGIGITPDGKTLLVAETFAGSLIQIYRRG